MVTSPFPVPRFCDLWRQRWEGRSFSPHVDSRSRASFSRGKKLRFKVVRRGTNRSPIEKRSFSAQQSAVFRIVREQMRNCVEWREGLFAWNSILSSLHSNRQQSVRIFIFHAERIDIENRGATLGELSTWVALEAARKLGRLFEERKGRERERERERERRPFHAAVTRAHTRLYIYYATVSNSEPISTRRDLRSDGTTRNFNDDLFYVQSCSLVGATFVGLFQEFAVATVALSFNMKN